MSIEQAQEKLPKGKGSRQRYSRGRKKVRIRRRSQRSARVRRTDYTRNVRCSCLGGVHAVDPLCVDLRFGGAVRAGHDGFHLGVAGGEFADGIGGSSIAGEQQGLAAASSKVE